MYLILSTEIYVKTLWYSCVCLGTQFRLYWVTEILVVDLILPTCDPILQWTSAFGFLTQFIRKWEWHPLHSLDIILYLLRFSKKILLTFQRSCLNLTL
jgi:hypothetical protein